MFYTGVGARKTPQHILKLMTAMAVKMTSLGYTLRSGGAIGADTAFELGAGPKEIYVANQANEAAMSIAAKFHPAWDKCSRYAKMLHGRNAFQLLGINLNLPSLYCICWTPDGATTHRERVYQTGGTGTAISIADAYNIPVINLAIPSHYNTYIEWLNQ